MLRTDLRGFDLLVPRGARSTWSLRDSLWSIHVCHGDALCLCGGAKCSQSWPALRLAAGARELFCHGNSGRCSYFFTYRLPDALAPIEVWSKPITLVGVIRRPSGRFVSSCRKSVRFARRDRVFGGMIGPAKETEIWIVAGVTDPRFLNGPPKVISRFLRRTRPAAWRKDRRILE